MNRCGGQLEMRQREHEVMTHLLTLWPNQPLRYCSHGKRRPPGMVDRIGIPLSIVGQALSPTQHHVGRTFAKNPRLRGPMKQFLQNFLPRSKRTSPADGNSPTEARPPRSLQKFVGGAYDEVGAEFAGYLVDMCGLRAGDAVLDVGCGSGRIALPLTGHLNSEGRYSGFDISEKAILWCQQNITPSHPNFQFEVADIYNSLYNPKGKYQSLDFRFPYPDASFDVVFLTSVFTHMFPPDVEHYLHEIARVLKPGGRSLCTYFLLNDESLALTAAGKGVHNFQYQEHGYRTIHKKRPEEAIALPENFVRDLYANCDLKVQEPLRYGSWSGRKDHLSFQDIVIATKVTS